MDEMVVPVNGKWSLKGERRWELVLGSRVGVVCHIELNGAPARSCVVRAKWAELKLS